MNRICLLITGLAISVNVMAQNESYATLAEQAQDKLHNSFRSSSGSYYIENNGTTNTYFHYWWNAHALDVLVDGYLRTNDSKYVTRINTLVNNWSNNNGGTIYKDYYDDMEWFVLSLFRAYEATGNSTFLNMSTDIWDDIKTGENGNQGGGIAWRKSQLDYKNTPANAPAIIYACRRHQKWGHSWELDIATRLYNWQKSTLVTSAGRVRDGINRQGNGQIDDWQFTYNYGTFIGAALEMYQSTGNSTYLNDAITSADYAIQSAGLTNNGVFKNEGDRDAGLFKGILVRYLAILAQEPAVSSTKRNYYQNVLEDQALSIHSDGFNRTYDIIGLDWTQTPGSSTWMSAQLSGIMMLEVAADMGFSAPASSGVVTLYEHCGYGGYSAVLSEGSYTLSQLQALGVVNDDISSIQVQNGYEVTMYQHHDFTGNSLVKSGDDWCLDDDGFNDDISSLVVSQTGGARMHAETLLDEIKTETKFFPNPVTRGSSLKIQPGSHVDQLKVNLLDLMGRKVYSGSASDGDLSIATEHLKSGTYLLQIQEDSGLMKTSKIIVQ